MKAYQIKVPLSLNCKFQVYKFGVQLPDKPNEVFWEQIPHCSHVSVWNRKQYVDVEIGNTSCFFQAGYDVPKSNQSISGAPASVPKLWGRLQ